MQPLLTAEEQLIKHQVISKFTRRGQDDLSPVLESPFREGLEVESFQTRSKESDKEMGTCNMVTKIASMWSQLTLTITVALLIESSNVIMVGHLNDPTALAAVGLGNMMLNMVFMGSITGMNSALEILVAQAYGTKQYRLAG